MWFDYRAIVDIYSVAQLLNMYVILQGDKFSTRCCCFFLFSPSMCLSISRSLQNSDLYKATIDFLFNVFFIFRFFFEMEHRKKTIAFLYFRSNSNIFCNLNAFTKVIMCGMELLTELWDRFRNLSYAHFNSHKDINFGR